MSDKQLAKLRDKQAAINHVVASLQAKHGKHVVQYLQDVPDVSYLACEVAEMDGVLHGGLPRGRLFEVYGLKQSGKTAVACFLVRQAETVVYIDAEKKMTKAWASMLGLPDGTIIARPGTIEEAFDLCRKFIKLGVDAVILDSLPALPSEKESEEEDMTKNTGFSATAGFLSRKLPVMLHLLYEYQSVLIIVNQLRANVNATPWGEQYHTFGGMAMGNYASVRIATARKSWLKHPTLGVYGMELAIMVDKTNTGVPRQGTTLPLLYDVGVVPNDQHADAKKELIQQYKEMGKAPRPQPAQDAEEELATVVTELDSLLGDK